MLFRAEDDCGEDHWVPGEPTKAQLIRSKDFSTDLISGKTGCTRFQAQRATSTLEVSLYYNRSFELAISDSNGRWSGSYSTGSVRILVLSLCRQSCALGAF